MKKTLHLFTFLTLLLGLASLFPLAPVSAHPTATFNVDTATDAHDSNLSDGICNNGIDGCSLRAAIEQAFSTSTSGNPLTIHFGAALSGNPINLNLGPINWAASYVTLDGGTNNIIVDGSTLAAGQSMFRISGSNNTLTRLVIRHSPWDGIQVGDLAGVGEGNYNVINSVTLFGNGAAGLFVQGSASSGGHHTSITNSLIGASSWAAPSCVAGEGNGGDGILIGASANNTDVNGNRLVCNSGYGVYVHGSGGSPTGVQIRNSDIGGYSSHDMGNASGGIRDEQASGTTISHNVIIGNGYDGVWLTGDSQSVLKGNMIGYSDQIGTTATPNDVCGVAITDSAHDNTVGGSIVADRNFIGGNLHAGVCIEAGAHNNTLDFNYIGLSYNGMAAVPNGTAGVAIVNANNNQVGSSQSGATQHISGNTREGIYIENSDNTFIGQVNRIGVAADDVTDQGNGLQGILLVNSSNTFVAPAIIAYNGEAGVAVTGNAEVGNKITPIMIGWNGGLPIDLGNDGATPNDPGDSDSGPNTLLNYPVVTSWSGSPVVLVGTTCANCEVWICQAIGNPGANGGGGTYIQYATANAAGNWTATLPAGVSAGEISLTAVQPIAIFAANTSEMSPIYRLYLPLVQR